MIYESMLSIDGGFGDIKAYWRSRLGERKQIKFSSIVAEAPLEAFDMPLLEGKRYFMGEEALMRDSKDIVEITSYEKLKQFMPLFIYKVMEILGIKAEDIDYLVTGLSLAQVDLAKDFVKRISKFKINSEVYNFENKITLLPQGVGAKYAIDEYFTEVPKAYLIIDIGFLTIDVVDVINGKVRPENVKGYSNEGVIKIARKLQDYILDTYNELISLKEVKELLETKELVLEGQRFDLSDYIKEISKTYTEQTIKMFKSRYDREFKKYLKIYFVGGGAYFIDKSISNIIEVVPEPEYYNALGNIFYKEKQLSASK